MVEVGARLNTSEMAEGIKRVIRSDCGVAHRLSLSARVVSTVFGQVKRNDNERNASGACGIGMRFNLMRAAIAGKAPEPAGPQLRHARVPFRARLRTAPYPIGQRHETVPADQQIGPTSILSG